MAWFTTSDGAKLHYRISGRGTPAIVLVHGWCSNLTHWDRQVRVFSRRHRVLRVDRRGCGKSSVPSGDVSPRQHSDDLAALVRSLELSEVVVVGHAGGGPTTLEFARRHPDLVKAAVLVDAGLYKGVTRDQARRSPFAQRLEQPDYLEFFMGQYRSYFHALSGKTLAEKVAKEAARTPQHVIVNEIHWIFRANTIAMARQVKQPVLWVVSSETRQSAGHIRQFLPQAEFAQVVKAGHFLHMEVPEQFNAMLRRFIAGL